MSEESPHPERPMFHLIWADKEKSGVQLLSSENHNEIITLFREKAPKAHWAFMTDEKPDHDGEPSNTILRQKT